MFGTWTHQAYVKASNPDSNDYFGENVALSDTGTTLAVTSVGEDSSAEGVNQGDQADNSIPNGGAVYVYTRDQFGMWTQQAYVKASNSDLDDVFGYSIALDKDGATLAVGSFEDSNTVGVDGTQTDNSLDLSGAVYIFARDPSDVWTQRAYVKASNPGMNDQFGTSVALDEFGNTLAVGALGEASNATGIGGNQADNSAPAAGAVYLY
jgi:hypothetical protein